MSPPYIGFLLLLPMQLDFLMLPDALNVALVAHGDVAVVAAQHHLGTLGNDIAIVNTGIDGGLSTAVADGLDLLNGVRHLHQTAAAGEEPGLEVRPQAEAHDGNIIVVDDGAQLVDLVFRQELALVHDDHIALTRLLPLEGVNQVHLRRDDLYRCCQADAAAQDLDPVTGVRAGLDEPDLQVVLLVIVFGDQGLGGLAGAHGTVLEI